MKKIIINVANKLIKNNNERKEKNLWTSKNDGSEVLYKKSSLESEEGKFVIDEINSLLNDGYKLKDMAILYRMNAQSRIFEEYLMKNLLDYKVVGGLKFYDRKEIKDLVSYLKILVNPKDDISLKRIINEPKKGIGDKTVEKLEKEANKLGFSLTELVCDPSLFSNLSTKLKSSCEKFYNPLAKIFDNYKDYDIVELIEEILDKSGYIKALEESYSVENRSRIDNLNEFISSAAEYQSNNPEDNIYDYLENLSLLSDLDKTENSDDAISLMTIHSAKGLEFKVCFVVGMDEDLFPSKRSIDEGNIEEERRLCYVGITRAMKELTLTSAQQRMVRGETQYNRVSRFVREIPRELVELGHTIQEHKPKMPETTSAKSSYMQMKMAFQAKAFQPKSFQVKKAESLDYGVGDTVRHVKFGVGIVKDIVEGGRDYEVTVDFDRAGTKKMFAGFAKLKKI